MSDRDCQNCINGSVNGCVSWDCNFISRKEAREAVKRTKWIPVSERLPEENGMYLITKKYKRSGVVSVSLCTFWNGVWMTTDDEVFAWMPLPKPCKELNQ